MAYRRNCYYRKSEQGRQQDQKTQLFSNRYPHLDGGSCPPLASQSRKAFFWSGSPLAAATGPWLGSPILESQLWHVESVCSSRTISVRSVFDDCKAQRGDVSWCGRGRRSRRRSKATGNVSGRTRKKHEYGVKECGSAAEQAVDCGFILVV